MNRKQMQKYALMLLVCIIFLNLRAYELIQSTKINALDGFCTGFSVASMALLLYEVFLNKKEEF